MTHVFASARFRPKTYRYVFTSHRVCSWAAMQELGTRSNWSCGRFETLVRRHRTVYTMEPTVLEPFSYRIAEDQCQCRKPRATRTTRCFPAENIQFKCFHTLGKQTHVVCMCLAITAAKDGCYGPNRRIGARCAERVCRECARAVRVSPPTEANPKRAGVLPWQSCIDGTCVTMFVGCKPAQTHRASNDREISRVCRFEMQVRAMSKREIYRTTMSHYQVIGCHMGQPSKV